MAELFTLTKTQQEVIDLAAQIPEARVEVAGCQRYGTSSLTITVSRSTQYEDTCDACGHSATVHGWWSVSFAWERGKFSSLKCRGLSTSPRWDRTYTRGMALLRKQIEP